MAAPRDAEELAAMLARPGAGSGAGRTGGGLIARGLGRSYGDAAQCAGGTVIDLRSLSHIGPIDAESGQVEVGGGTSLQALLERSLPQGWFLPVSPGTRQVTVGGAIAADVHGKNHHRDGSFCRHVTTLTLATPAGVHRIGPDQDPELFWATAGAMGLTGVVAQATVRMTPIETTWMLVDTERFDDIGGVMAAMEEGDARYRYSVAWIDCAASGRRGGRSVLTRGDHAARSDLPVRRRSRPLLAPGAPHLTIPRPAPSGMLNAVTVGAFNELWFRKAPRRRDGALHSLASFFHPLDGVDHWNLLYGRRGFVQYQMAVGPDQGEAVRRAVSVFTSSKFPSFLAVLKRFGPGDPGPLSFPMEGWTLAVDLPVGPAGLATLLDRLDELVAGAGGRVYLAKDARLRPELLPVMYPRLPELLAARRRVDPDGLLRSDLSRRLGIDDLRTVPR